MVEDPMDQNRNAIGRGHGPSEAARELFGGLYDDDDPVARICREARPPVPAPPPLLPEAVSAEGKERDGR
jgi:hypothetical protein